MRKWITCLLLFLSLIYSISCKKQRGTFTQVKGKVLEHGSGLPVENALVKFVKLRYSTFNVNETILDSMRSGKDGSYFFSLDTDADDYELLVFAETKSHFHHNLSSAVSQPRPNILRGVNQHVDVIIIPYGWVRIRALNTKGNDYVFINPIIGSGSPFGINMTDGMTRIRRTFGNYGVEVYTFLRKNNLETGKKTYYLNTTARDTTDVIIHY